MNENLSVGIQEAGSRLDLYLADKLGVSRTKAATLIATGSVDVSGRSEKAAYKVEEGDSISVELPEVVVRTVEGEDIPLNIVYEDDDLLIVDKEAGMVVHPAPGNWSGTLVNALLGRGQNLPFGESQGLQRAGLVHRLDKETSGLLVIAKSELVHQRLSKALAERKVVRRYAALVWGHLKQDVITVDRPIARDPRDRKKMAIVEGGKPARTDFWRVGKYIPVDLLRASLHTGRTHQIRVHLASIGHPVVGDDTYGGGGGRKVSQLPPKRHFLHAAWLRFRHPVTGEEMDFKSSLPKDLQESLSALSGMSEYVEGVDALESLNFFDES